jgi:hypothetical protein
MRVQKGTKAKAKRGRKPLGARAQTGAERKRKHDREKRRHERRERFVHDYNWLAERCSVEQKLRIEQSEYRVYEIRAVAQKMERERRPELIEQVTTINLAALTTGVRRNAEKAGFDLGAPLFLMPCDPHYAGIRQEL